MSFAIIELKGYMFQHFSFCIAVVRHVWLCSSHSNATIRIDAHDDFCKSSAAGITDNQWLMPGMDITCRLASRFDFIPGLALGHIKCSYSIEKGIFFQTRCGMRLGCCPGLFCTASVNPWVLGAWRTRTHTLAQNNLCEFWCGMHPTCKNTPNIPDWKKLKIRSEKDREECISRPLLDATFPSEPSHYLPDIKFGLKIVWKNDVPVVGLAGCHHRK